MSRWLCGLVVLCALGAHGARAATTVEVLDTFPAGDDVALKRNENFYIHLHYVTDRPAGIWIQPFFHGEPARAGTSGSYSYTGSGEALGWFFFIANSGEVDEIRITAGDGSRDGTPVVLSYPVHVTASEETGAEETQPEWVTRLRERQAEQQQAAYQAYVNQPRSAGSGLLVNAFMLAALAFGVGGVFLPLRALMRWRGGWRLAAGLPAALMAFVVLRIIVGVAADPTSHNLWPFEILIAGFASAVIMVVLMLVRKAARVNAS